VHSLPFNLLKLLVPPKNLNLLTPDYITLEVEKINNRLNKRKLEEIDTKEVPHLLKVFNF